jgi:anhydro-N-acetylmuramic acid kinase
MEIYALDHYDCLATLSDLICETILLSYVYLPQKPKLAIIVGGGAKNRNLILNLRKKLNHNVLVGCDVGLNVDYVESELIGFLAARFLNKRPSTFSTTTGVIRPTVLGVESK